ncbi:MAG: zinc-dependent metalloprotease [Bacteroidota bacterium]
MSKKLQLFCVAILGSIVLKGQLQQAGDPNFRQSGTEAPSQQWNNWFNKEVEKFEQNLQSGKATNVAYRIPIIFHVIHTGEAIGTYPNLSVAQVTSQVTVLNADYAGIGLNVGNVPQAFANLVSNTNIQFCLATKDPFNVPLAEPGIHRVNATTSGWASPSATANIVSYINNQVKPFHCWDPTKYLNIWVSDKTASLTILGFATYPAGTSLVGIPNSGGTSLDDGVWCWSKTIGNTGALAAPHDKGRVATKEVAHWLGIRNIWGDGNCLDDYCTDTPWAKQANTGCPPYPSYVNRCGINQSPNGEMTMNFMDETDDACRFMFTHKQTVRMQTAMSQCNYRNLLGTHGLCSYTQVAAPAVASFTFNDVLCANTQLTPNNTSTGWPAPTYQWNVAPGAGINPAPSVASPMINFPGAGTYTLYMTATNTTNISSYTAVVTVVNCPATQLCLDTVRMIKPYDTLATYKSANSALVSGCATGFAGYLTGTNCYKDKEFAQFIPATTYSAISFPQVNSVIVLFDSVGTKATAFTAGTQIACILYSGNATTGPNTQFALKSDSLKKIQSGQKLKWIRYVGSPTYSFQTTKIIPFKFDFAQPVLLTPNTPGFFASVQTPFNSVTDSINIFGNTKTNLSTDSSSWVLLNPSNNWRTMRFGRNAKIQLAIMPQITCRPVVGIKEQQTEFSSNISVMPNPNNGQFSLVFTLPKEQDLNISVYNAIGQQISGDRLENVTHDMINMDLGDRSDGIYFIEISNGSERVTHKVIVSK